MDRRAIPWIALALVAGFALGRLTGRDARPSPAATLAPEPSDPRAAAELRDLRRAVEALAARLDRDDASPARRFVDEAPDERERAPLERGAADAPASAELRALLARLQAQVAEEHALTRAALAEATGAEPAIAHLRRATGEPDWDAWQPILAAWRRDPAEAREAVKLLTAEELLERFGPPTDVWNVAQGITWQYARDPDPLDGSFGTEIILRVPDGYVTQLAVRGREW